MYAGRVLANIGKEARLSVKFGSLELLLSDLIIVGIDQARY